MIKQMRNEIGSVEDFLVIAIGKRMMDFVENYCPENILEEHYASCINDEIISHIASVIIKRIEEGTISSCHLFYNKFHNVINQEAMDKILVPLDLEGEKDPNKVTPTLEGGGVLDKLLHLYIMAELKNAQVHSSASEEAARTTAMDNATRNAGDLVDKLTLVMNRKRQAVITKELIEIISGAEAV
jgi:F-type H+-transporting ATPase subunit gamma